MTGFVQHRLGLCYANSMPTNRRHTLEKGKTMKRKDYKALAQVIVGFQRDIHPDAYALFVWQLGEVFARDNERFDMVRWEDACGLTHELIANTK